MKQTALSTAPPYYHNYIQQVPKLPLNEALRHTRDILDRGLEEKLLAIGDAVYEPGKWTVKDILQHLIDTERVMSYRALRFARQDKTELPGFDQDPYVPAALAGRRTILELLEELKAVRAGSILLFDSFTDEMLRQTGVANKNEISVLALGFIIAGHQLHHLRIIEERYRPLVKKPVISV